MGHTDIIDCFIVRGRGSTKSASALPSRGDRRTEDADFDRLEFLEKCLPSRLINRCKVDNERLGLYTSITTTTATATCVDYIHDTSILMRDKQKVEEKKRNPAPISSTTVSSLAWFRAARRTLYPALASWIANSRPMPSDAPVTTYDERASTTRIRTRHAEVSPTDSAVIR